jgi:hypothetical protein
MADEQDNRKLTYGFEIQHVITRSTVRDAAIKALLDRAGISLDMEGNKLAVIKNTALAEKVRAASDAVKQTFLDAGWGFGVQNSLNKPNAHPELR